MVLPLEGLDPSWAHATALAVTPVIIIIIIKWHARRRAVARLQETEGSGQSFASARHLAPAGLRAP